MLRIVTRSLVMAALVAFAAPAFGQPAQTGTISGEVLDATGGALPGVSVTITSQDRGFSRSAVTDENGRYVFPAVPIGPYRITATLQGFETAQASDNLVETEKTTNVPFQMKIGALTDTVQVLGDVPIVDPTTVTANTRLRREEFERLPVGRSYQALIGATPGVVGTGNVNAMGALTSQNVFIVDSVDTTDPTTGTFGTNLNFEAIQEVSVYTTGAGAEYGRAQGAIINVITKSGTNRFEGSLRHIISNDDWNAQNDTTSEVSGASLARVKFDKINPIWGVNGGGPIWRDRAWFFGAYEHAKNTTPQQQTQGQIPEDYQQSTKNKFANVRGTIQLATGQTLWAKYYRAPTDGFVTNYWGAVTPAGEREALTAQNQGAENWAAQYSGVIKSNWSIEAAFADYANRIDVTTFEASGRLNNAPIFNETDNKWYNGATFDGFVDRPRQQFNLASNWFLTPGGRSHDVRVGLDFQRMESGSLFQYPNAQVFNVTNYSQATGAFTPSERLDYQTGDSTSTGKILSLYARDKLRVTDRVAVEVGLRYEKQTGSSDLGITTVDASAFSPRLAATYDLSGDGKTLVSAYYGRLFATILQGFSDSFAGVPQQENYDLFAWNGSAYVFSQAIRVGGSDFEPNTDLKPSHVDEFTLGFQRQFGRSMAAGVRFVNRKWGNLIDDILTFRSDNSVNRVVINYDEAERKYRGVQFTLEKRTSNNWNAQGSYTYSRTEGNHFADNFSGLGDFLDSQCRTTVDTSIGVGGTIPCAEVNNGANKFGRPIHDRPHNFKLSGAYVRPIGPIRLTFGALTEFISKRRYERQRSVNVMLPGTTTNSGQTAVYFYEPRGGFQLDGLENYIDFATEAGWRIVNTHEAALKVEIFNLTDNQEKIINNNVAFCGNTSTAACATAVNNFGKASARTAFLDTRRFRFSFIYRF
jgi:hypothetical protein